MGDLTIGRQQMVEIAKALSVNSRVLIMDEPTSSLSQAETENLCRDQGFAGPVEERNLHFSPSWRSEGTFRYATVLRDGENAGELSREEVTHEAMVRLMVGRDLSDYYELGSKKGDLALEVTKLRTPAHPQHELTFGCIRRDVAVAGLVGAGRNYSRLFWRGPALGGSIRVSARN